MSEKRIYCVVAKKVLAPLVFTHDVSAFGNSWVTPTATEKTQIIKQPPGRLVAQHGHAVSMVRDHMLKGKIIEALGYGKNNSQVKVTLTSAVKDKIAVNELAKSEFKPITTIVLSARNSFELYHILGLLNLAKIPTYPFYDTQQPDYGDPEYRVTTAIATEPVYSEDVIGILDYLPLWKPKKVKN